MSNFQLCLSLQWADSILTTGKLQEGFIFSCVFQPSFYTVNNTPVQAMRSQFLHENAVRNCQKLY